MKTSSKVTYAVFALAPSITDNPEIYGIGVFAVGGWSKQSTNSVKSSELYKEDKKWHI